MSAAVDSAKPPRQEWLDLFRGLAVVLMIETHCVNSFLSDALRQAAWFASLNFINGLVAPAFLFIAGYAQGFAARPNSASPFPWKKIRRLLAVLLAGYALHFPWAALGGAWNPDRGVLQSMFQVDVLQCLAVSLLILLAMERCARASFELAVAVVFLAVIVAAPFVRQVQVPSLAALPLAAYLNGQTGSLFPLLPWMGFVLAGTLVSRLRIPDFSMNVSAFAGCATAGLAVWTGGLERLYSSGDFFAENPVFFLRRLAWLVVLVPVCVLIQRRWSPRWLVFAGRESLMLYVIHLLLLYSVFGSFGSAASAVGRTQSLGVTLGLCAAVVAISFSLTRAVGFSWEKWKPTTS